MFLCCFCFV